MGAPVRKDTVLYHAFQQVKRAALLNIHPPPTKHHKKSGKGKPRDAARELRDG
jgi:hypothetical protein